MTYLLFALFMGLLLLAAYWYDAYAEHRDWGRAGLRDDPAHRDGCPICEGRWGGL